MSAPCSFVGLRDGFPPGLARVPNSGAGGSRLTTCVVPPGRPSPFPDTCIPTRALHVRRFRSHPRCAFGWFSLFGCFVVSISEHHHRASFSAFEFAVPGHLPRDALSPVTTVTSSTVCSHYRVSSLSSLIVLHPPSTAHSRGFFVSPCCTRVLCSVASFVVLFLVGVFLRCALLAATSVPPQGFCLLFSGFASSLHAWFPVSSSRFPPAPAFRVGFHSFVFRHFRMAECFCISSPSSSFGAWLRAVPSKVVR